MLPAIRIISEQFRKHFSSEERSERKDGGKVFTQIWRRVGR